MDASQHIKDILTREEIRGLVQASDWRGWLSVAVTWGLIAGAFALVGWWTHPLAIALALVVLGGRQLALAILMHDAAHRSLFRSRWLNETVGRWLCAAPVWQRLHDYRGHHLAHHAHTGTDKDPDLGLSEPFPTSRRSLLRKFARDLLGISGLKRIYGLLLMDFGFLHYTASTHVRPIDQSHRRWWQILGTGARHLFPVLLTNAALWGVLALFGAGWLYLLWVAAYLTTFSLFLRVRSMAEHACTSPDTDPFRNTRTTYANPLARLTVAPHYVNYHLEHHLLMTVPHYHLPRLHKILQERGALTHSPIAPHYRDVLRAVVTP